MFYREIFVVFSQIPTKHKHTLFGQNARVFNVILCVTYRVFHDFWKLLQEVIS